MPSNSAYRTMVVTGEEALARTICLYLRLSGLDCHHARTVDDALDAIEQQSPHIIIIDLGMAGSEGMNLTATLRQKAVLAQILVMSSEPTVDRIIDAYRIGASDYLIMPFENLDIIGHAVSEASARLTKWKRTIEKILPEETL